MADVIEQPLQESTAMSLTAALSELSVVSHDAMQHPIQDSTGQPIQPRIAEMSGTQSTDNVNEPLAETHTGPPAVIFKCAQCNLHFNTEKRLRNHIRYSPAHTTGSGSAKKNGRRSDSNPQRFRIQADRRDSHASTAFNGVNRNFTFDQILPNLPTSPGHTIRPKIPVTADLYDMRPDLHDDVLRLLEPYGLSFGFFTTDNPQGQLQEYDTSIVEMVLVFEFGRVGWPPSQSGSTLRISTTQGSTTNAANPASLSAGQS
ncbi:hypothetical protein LTR10_011845 [Elasticomyces elasticus]|nr:hypothetical protein LTR10_011845 [Elasticomyces elasticus]KAK4968790.1 hypothetical protein LTR42_009067 [Elasticomyces elasticus]